MTLRLKEGVSLELLCPQMVLAVMVLEGIYRGFGAALTITSGAEGDHKAGSLHFSGRALDFRVHNLSPGKIGDMVLLASTALGRDFTVLREDQGLPTDHLHIEYQPH